MELFRIETTEEGVQVAQVHVTLLKNYLYGTEIQPVQNAVIFALKKLIFEIEQEEQRRESNRLYREEMRRLGFAEGETGTRGGCDGRYGPVPDCVGTWGSCSPGECASCDERYKQETITLFKYASTEGQ